MQNEIMCSVETLSTIAKAYAAYRDDGTDAEVTYLTLTFVNMQAAYQKDGELEVDFNVAPPPYKDPGNSISQCALLKALDLYLSRCDVYDVYQNRFYRRIEAFRDQVARDIARSLTGYKVAKWD